MACHAWLVHAWLISGIILMPVPHASGVWQYDGPPGEEQPGWLDPATSQFTYLSAMGESADSDNDSLTNEQEFVEGSNPFVGDSDYDGLPDGFEATVARPVVLAAYGYSLSLTSWDSNGNLISDHDEFYKAIGCVFPDIYYPNGEPPTGQFPNSTYDDYDGDGVKNQEDPVFDSIQNYSTINSMQWPGVTAIADDDGDGVMNWWDPDPFLAPPPQDADGDGIVDSDDPVPNNLDNPSPTNGQNWPGTSARGDLDRDGILNWWDADADGDGLADPADDPVPGDAQNYSPYNSTNWPGASAYGDLDGDNLANWWDPDVDGDGLDASSPDPVAEDPDNYSPNNGLSWPGTTATQDNDGDGIKNWWDTSPDPTTPTDTDGDGLPDDVDPEPQSADNFSPTNGRNWPGVTANADNDTDGVRNWEDPDTDGDGLPDSLNGTAYDPVPDDPNNPSPNNNMTWPGETALADPDGNLVPNWWEPDTDGDGILDIYDPAPTDAANYSPINCGVWPGTSVFGNIDTDGIQNWWDADADGDGLSGEADPVPDSYANYSPTNQIEWPGTTAADDYDGDNIINWADVTPYYIDPPPVDTDGDGLYDDEEAMLGTDINNQDTDDDDLTDFEEARGGFGSNPLDKFSLCRARNWGELYADWQMADLSDNDPLTGGGHGDGIPDRIELLYGLNPNDPADAYGDLDSDGVSNLVQYLNYVQATLLLLPVEVETIGFQSPSSISRGYGLAFESDDKQTFYQDTGGDTGGQWLDKNGDMNATKDGGERNWPIAFKAGDAMQVRARLKVPGLAANSTVSVLAECPGKLRVEWPSVAVSNDHVDLDYKSSTVSLPAKVQCYSHDSDNDAFKITWKVKVGQSAYTDVGTSKHTLYVPLPGYELKCQETLLYIACKEASKGNYTTPNLDLAKAVFKEFEDRVVCKVKPTTATPDGTAMEYNHTSSRTTGGAEELILDGKGRCGHWVKLFQEALARHGIYSTDAKKVEISPKNPAAVMTAFEQAWSGQLPSNIYPVVFIKNWNASDEELVWSPIDEDGVPAQGNPNPSSVFLSHVVAEYAGQVFDPSYGTKYAKPYDLWENSALDYIGVAKTSAGGVVESLWAGFPNTTARETEEH